MSNGKEKDILISIIIPTYNRADALQLTLEYLARQDFSEKWETIVVNNNSTDNTDDVVKNQKFPVLLSIIHEKKAGASAARNAGVKAAKGKYLIFIDNDILTEPDFIERHYKQIKKNTGNWFVGHVINLPEQEATIFGKFRKYLDSPIKLELIEVDFLTGANVSIIKDDFKRLGGFDENFHVASGEDRELAMRAIKSGIKIFFDPSIVVVHNDWAGSSIRDFCKRQRIYTETEPFFWQKYGNETPRMEMVLKNSPPNLKTDGAKLFLWKHIKSFLGSDSGQAGIIRLCELTEKVFPKPQILWHLYRLAIAGAIYKGFQEGLKLFPQCAELKSDSLKVKDELSTR